MQVGRDDGIDTLGVQDHTGGHGIDQHLVHSDIGEVPGNLLGHLVPEDHPVALGIALGHDGQELARALLGRLEGKAHDALDAVAREDGDLGRAFPGLAGVRAAALTGVLTLAVLADDDPVEIAGVAFAQGRLRAAEDPGWSHIGVLLEGLADSQTETPEGNVVGNVCMFVRELGLW